MDSPRSITSLGLLVLFVSLFLAWFPNGTNISGMYLLNGQFNTAAVSSSSAPALTVTFLLYPLGLLIALRASWKRSISPWQVLVIVPSIAWILYQNQEGVSVTPGPLAGLLGGLVLVAGYSTNVWMLRRYGISRGNDYPRNGYRPKEYRGRGRYSHFSRPRGNIKLLAGIWVLLAVVGFLLGGAYLWFPAYYWYLPGLVAFVIGIFGGLRIWRYAMRVNSVQSAWTTRIVMTLGLFITGFLIFMLFVGTTIADVSLNSSTQYALQPSVANAAANVGTGFMMSLIAFIVPSFLAFGAGEAYLLYRLGHHYTISSGF